MGPGFALCVLWLCQDWELPSFQLLSVSPPAMNFHLPYLCDKHSFVSTSASPSACPENQQRAPFPGGFANTSQLSVQRYLQHRAHTLPFVALAHNT